MQKYEINDRKIKSILSDIEDGKISMPEIQRPFVWDTVKVRDLIDSIYKGFPIGYIITSANPELKTKTGETTRGKTLIIDGQQRLTALRAAVLGEQIVDKNYRKRHIRISFNPMTEVFETQTPALTPAKGWVPDIATILADDFDMFAFIENYTAVVDSITKNELNKVIMRLQNTITGHQLGCIQLSHTLDVDTVADIFVRINSKGAQLNQADFAMSKIASNDEFGGSDLRKTIDYFAHLIRHNSAYDEIVENDPDFTKTELFRQISWLKNDKSSLYDPDYSDIMRVAFSSQYNRGKLADLVSLLSGRNFETRTYEAEIVRDTFERLQRGVLAVVRESNFTDFMQIIKGTGFIHESLISSQTTLNFAYILFLNMRASDEPRSIIHKTVARWFVMSILTGRYSSSAETSIDRDLRDIARIGAPKLLENIEAAELSDTYWNVGLLQDMDRSIITHPYINTFFAAQIKLGDRGFLSSSVTLYDIKDIKGDIHHLFPRDYLKKNSYDNRGEYNQIANYAYTERYVNIQISNQSPDKYMETVNAQCHGGDLKIGNIQDAAMLKSNLDENCIPAGFEDMTYEDYPRFLDERRKLMVEKIRYYYDSL